MPYYKYKFTTYALAVEGLKLARRIVEDRYWYITNEGDDYSWHIVEG